MATAVTLKESDGSEIYPVTDISLVNNGIHAVDIQATTPVPAVETAMIADGAVTSAKLKGWSTANTTDEWVPVATSNYELQHRLIKPFNADGTIPTSAIANSAVTNAKIDWSSTTRPLYYTGTDWATSWTFKYYRTRPQLIFVAWQSSVAMFARIYDTIYKVFQNGGSTITATIDSTNTKWTITTSNTGVLTVLEMNNVKPN